jgi:hypothetical protein
MSATRLVDRIQQAARIVVRQMSQANDSISQAVVGRDGDRRIVINSSFLSRDLRSSVKTTQSSRRLTAQLVVAGKQVRASTVGVMDDRPLKGHYKILPAQDTKGVVTLGEAVAQELGRVGDLLFVLVGTIVGLRPHRQEVPTNPVQELHLDPAMKQTFSKVGEASYALKTILPIEDLLVQISETLHEGVELSLTDRQAIAGAYNELLDAATTNVAIPSGQIERPTETVLGQIVNSLEGQKKEYSNAVDALRKAPDDRHALHEVLRIAYNFSTDVLPLMSLFMSVCDLKPLVFWCTVDAQWALYAAFASLPWSALGRKESLHEYQGIVSQARNHAFHHLLPFDATVEIDLLNLNVRAEKIRLFLPFGERQGRGVRIQDQEIADVLAEFSRARQLPVSTTFWQANLGVMQASCTLAQCILDSIILIRGAKAN